MISYSSHLLAITSGSSALISFLLYLVAVFFLAWLSSRVRSKEGFVDEYFLGSRNLGVWAFALTFAATSASGGSFVGFPALIYTHGWVLALWIAGYMVVPIVAMGLLGKRMNHISRAADALTIPDVIAARFSSAAAGIVATILIVVFMFYYLLAQFKAGSQILVSLLRGVPVYDQAVAMLARNSANIPWLQGSDPDYVLCLTVFASAVILYVVYGGFRAVVWTDVMQGVIMFFGVVVLLILVLRYTGGLANATKQLARHTPPRNVKLTISVTADQVLAQGVWLADSSDSIYRVARRLFLTESGEQTVEAIELTCQADRDLVPPSEIRRDLRIASVERLPYAYGVNQPGVYLRPPGPDPDNRTVSDDSESPGRPLGFLPLSIAFSFFVFWPFGGSGQPSNMVRLMAFRDDRTLKWSIITVCLYFSFIYFALVVIFCCSKTLLPGMEIEADRVMPQLAVETTSRANVPWMAGLLLAAPFAAVMSSVDSFLLVVASSLVRDIYQRYINPTASEIILKRVTYIGTVVIGVLATLAALHPPQYLQDIIVRASGGLAASFLVPVGLAMYWRRMTAAGAIAGMVSGCLTHFVLSFGADWFAAPVAQPAAWTDYAISALRPIFVFYQWLGLEPFLWDLAISAVAVVVVSYLTRRPDAELVERFFSEP